MTAPSRDYRTYLKKAADTVSPQHRKKNKNGAANCSQHWSKTARDLEIYMQELEQHNRNSSMKMSFSEIIRAFKSITLTPDTKPDEYLRRIKFHSTQKNPLANDWSHVGAHLAHSIHSIRGETEG